MYTYKNFNNRPDKDLKLDDCVIRATAFASGLSYFDVLKIFGKTEEYRRAVETGDPTQYTGVPFMEYKKNLLKFPVRPKKASAVIDDKIWSIDYWAEISKRIPDCTFVFCVRSRSKTVTHTTACKAGTVYDCWREGVFRYFKFMVMDVMVFQNK